MKVYWNGNIVEDHEVCVSPWDLGLLRGFGVFDYFGVYNGKPFMIEAHFVRLETSAKVLSIPVPVSKDSFIEMVMKLIRENDLTDCFIRVVLTGGVSSDGITRDGAPTFLIRPEIAKPKNKKLYEDGGALITTEYTRDTPQAKTTNYAEALKNADRLKKESAVEMLFTDNGHALECSRSNIFIVSSNTLTTPRDSILLGITRAAVLEEAKKHSIKVEERSITIDELLRADEVFITGTGKGIVPIVMIDEKVISHGTPGKITQVLMKAVDERKKEHA